MLPFVYNDGGRQAAGFRGRAGDCVVRAVAIAAQLPYREVYDELSYGMMTQRKTKRAGPEPSAANGVYVTRLWFKRYMTELGFVWVPTMTIGSGCKVHLSPGELPAGRLVVSVSKHYTAVIDGVIHDTFNCSAQRSSIIYPRGSTKVPKLAVPLNGGGWLYTPERCVYGYWKPKIAGLLSGE